MSDSGSIILTENQVAQFEIEIDRFGVQLTDMISTNPIVGALAGRAIQNAKAKPPETMELLIRLGREISEAVNRIKDADNPSLHLEEGAT